MFWFSILFRLVMVFYFVYTFFELATISAVFYFDDLFTVTGSTLLGSFGFITLLIFFLTFFFDLSNLLVLSIGPVLSGFLSVSLVFGFILINDLLVSDILDLLIELPLELTGFFYYSSFYVGIVVLLKIFAASTKPGMWFLSNILSFALITVGFIPGILAFGTLFMGFIVSGCYTLKPNQFLAIINES